MKEFSSILNENHLLVLFVKSKPSLYFFILFLTSVFLAFYVCYLTPNMPIFSCAFQQKYILYFDSDIYQREFKCVIQRRKKTCSY